MSFHEMPFEMTSELRASCGTVRDQRLFARELPESNVQLVYVLRARVMDFEPVSGLACLGQADFSSHQGLICLKGIGPTLKSLALQVASLELPFPPWLDQVESCRSCNRRGGAA